MILFKQMTTRLIPLKEIEDLLDIQPDVDKFPEESSKPIATKF